MSLPDRPCRSYLFAPASNERLVRKALQSGADAVVLDLEDSIDQKRRTAAHAILKSASTEIQARPTHIRVAIVGDRYEPADVRLAADLGVEAIRLPKVESVEAVASVDSQIGALGCPARLHLTIESAVGLAHVDGFAATSDRVTRLVFGERDFLADMGVDEPGPLTDHARAEIALKSRSLVLHPPIDGAFIDLDDQDGLESSCLRAKRLGFSGKSSLHPRQLETIHRVFSPSTDEIESATAIVQAFEDALTRGEVTAVVDGRFVDEAVARRARSVLSMKEAKP